MSKLIPVHILLYQCLYQGSPIMAKHTAGLPLLCQYLSKLFSFIQGFYLLCQHFPQVFHYYAKRYPTVLPIKPSSTIITTRIPGLTLPLLCQHFYFRCCQNYSQNMGPSSLINTYPPFSSIMSKFILGIHLFFQHLSQIFPIIPTLITGVPQ